ncbi:MAG TPA: 4Fe-4S dicluster domain-containing protein [Myxococcota bacterium]|nr:4Fe-4S dicluster domain-containing protein [Myxococcota bacterium]
MKIEEKIALCSIKQHPDSHITLDAAGCAKCKSHICTRACPAHLYTLESGSIKIDHSGCLECGTCLVICPLGAVSWNYPEPGFGIHYRFG